MTITRKKVMPKTAKIVTQKRHVRRKDQTLSTEINHKQSTTNVRRDFFKSLIGLHR